MKPIINVKNVPLEKYSKGKTFEIDFAETGVALESQKLGYNFSIIPPGKKGCPFHNHHINEEMFL